MKPLPKSNCIKELESLSARRAWIETGLLGSGDDVGRVALRKEGVD